MALIVISIVFHEHALHLKWMLWGIGEVLFFFVLTTVFYPRWKDKETKGFKWTVFLVAFGIRAIYAFVMLYYYYYETGIAFEYNVGDSLWYHRTSVLIANTIKKGDALQALRYLRHSTMGYSDQGYVLWLTLLYSIFGHSWFVPRLFKALMCAYMCVVIYK